MAETPCPALRLIEVRRLHKIYMANSGDDELSDTIASVYCERLRAPIAQDNPEFTAIVRVDGAG
jgi:hypothetical protein